MCGERTEADGRWRRPTGDGGGESGESWIWGKVAWGKTNPVVKSEVAVARSGKSAAAILATARSLIHATATPFSFFPFPFSFLHILFVSFHLILFLSFSITFLFAFHLILYPLAVESLD